MNCYIGRERIKRTGYTGTEDKLTGSSWTEWTNELVILGQKE